MPGDQEFWPHRVREGLLDPYRIMNPSLESGILLVAHSNAQYVAEAVALAYSIRLNSPGIHVCLATDQELDKRSASVFDRVIRYDFTGKEGVFCKLWLDEMSPYSEKTIFLDTDCFAYSDLSSLFHTWPEVPFVALGGNHATVRHWFRDGTSLRREMRVESFPCFVGDFYRFDRSCASLQIFERARALAGGYDRMGIRRLHGGMNEEPLLSLAMALSDTAAQERTGKDIFAIPYHNGISSIVTNVLRGEAEVRLDNMTMRPSIVHFASYRTRSMYFRDRIRIERTVAGLMDLPSWLLTAMGANASICFRLRRRIRRMKAMIKSQKV